MNVYKVQSAVWSEEKGKHISEVYIKDQQNEEEAERMREIQSSTEPEQAKYGTRGIGRPAATSKDGQDEEDSSASAAASAAAAAEAQRMSEKRAEWKRRAAMWDSDTEDEKIPEDDDDLIGYVALRIIILWLIRVIIITVLL